MRTINKWTIIRKLFFLDIKTGTGYLHSGLLGTYTWGCEGTKISWTGAWDGQEQESTDNILKECVEQNIAARICSNLTLNGYSDWLLPGETLIKKMHKYTIYENYLTLPQGIYWCCSQEDANTARINKFIPGEKRDAIANKSEQHSVLAVRKFDQ